WGAASSAAAPHSRKQEEVKLRPMTEASLVYQTVYLRCFIGELTAKCAKPSGVGGESRPVPIRLLLEHDHVFTPEEVKVLVDAFDDTLRALELVDREDRLTMTVAKLIIRFAKADERDPGHLRDMVLKTRTCRDATFFQSNEIAPWLNGPKTFKRIGRDL